jgi:ABC-2 type transport system permease protein
MAATYSPELSTGAVAGRYPARRSPLAAALSDTLHMTQRYLRALIRQPYFVAITLTQPVIWLLLFGALFKRVVEIPGFATTSYITFLAPGVVIMSAMFSNGWSGMSIIEDLDRGVMDRFLVSPVRRGALITGLLIYGAVVTLIQSLIIIVLALVLGARFDGGIVGMALLLVGTVLLGSAFSSLSNALALLLRQQESVIAANTFLVLPLSFLSETFMQLSLAPGWIQQIARCNPVNWAVQAGRAALGANTDWGLVLSRTGGLFILAVVCGWLSTRAFRAYQRSV